MRDIIYRVSILSLTLLFFACEKVDFDCNYTITNYTESRDGGEKVLQSGIILHSFYADTSLWEVKSYADAVEGKLTGKKGKLGETKLADITLRSGSNGEGTFLSLDKENVIMIACEETTKRYAWRVSEVYKGLERVRIPLIFQLWERSNLYAQGRWLMVDEFADERPQEYKVNCFTESTKGGTKTPVAGVETHVFYADSLLWEVKSYADAVAGKLTKRDGSGETMVADISFLSDTEGIGITYLDKVPAIFVASDSDSRYGWIFTDKENRWKNTAVVFQTWRRDAKYTNDDWTMLDEISSDRPSVEPAR